jgi:hypothetical protein
MKKLLTLIALAGMGAFMAGCAEEKPAPPPSSGTPTMHGPGSVGTPPMHNPATGDKMSDEKADKGDTDGDKDANADKDEKKEE